MSSTLLIRVVWRSRHDADVYLGDRRVPYVSRIDLVDSMLTVHQGQPERPLPGIEFWPMSGAVNADGRVASRYQVELIGLTIQYDDVFEHVFSAVEVPHE